MKNLFISMAVVSVIIFYACNQKNIIPDKVQSAFSQKFPNAKKIKWGKEDAKVWEAEFEIKGNKMSANFDDEGNWKETESEIETEALPSAVMNMLNTDFEGYQMEDEITKVEQPEQTEFEVIVKKDNQMLELLIGESGKLLKNRNFSEENENEQDEEMSENNEENENGEVEEDEKRGKNQSNTMLLGYRKDFDLSGLTFSTTGENEYFILKPGYQLVLEGKEDNETTILKITVLDETKKIGSIDTRIIEERESVNGVIVEVSHNYYAYCNETGDIYYFGEQVDIFEDGKLKGHEGAWQAFINGAKPGIIMPGKIILGDKYYQEYAPGVAMDRAENISVSVSFETPAGDFPNCLRTKETTALNPKDQEFKVYAPKIGLLKDENLLLTDYGQK